MVSQRLAKPSYLLDSLSSTLSVGATYTRLWCNGSIRGSNPFGQSSNLWGRAIHISVNRIAAIAGACKALLFGVRWFESNFTDQYGRVTAAARRLVLKTMGPARVGWGSTPHSVAIHKTHTAIFRVKRTCLLSWS